MCIIYKNTLIPLEASGHVNELSVYIFHKIDGMCIDVMMSQIVQLDNKNQWKTLNKPLPTCKTIIQSM